MLRTPEMSEEKMQERERLIRHFAEAKNGPHGIADSILSLAERRKYLFVIHIQTLESLKPKSNMPHYICGPFLFFCSCSWMLFESSGRISCFACRYRGISSLL